MLKLSQHFSIKGLPVADNVCAQVLREVEKRSGWSMAHVTMNSFAESLLHSHDEMTEIYVITKGCGELLVGTGELIQARYEVLAGSVHKIDPKISHMLRNKGGGHLEHLVFALPPFDPSDVFLNENKRWYNADRPSTSANLLPKVQECFDGAKIIPYSFPHLNLSIAFGRVINDPARRKQPHYHKERTEFVYVVEGKGRVQLNCSITPMRPGDWIRITPETEHALLNESPEDMIVVCVCSPAFQMNDVLYR